jgi:hypothetical protein
MMPRRGTTLGVAVSANAVHVLALEEGRVTWTAEIPVDATRSVEDALRMALADAPRMRSVAVAVGPAFAQLRRLHGLPAVRDRRMLATIVQASAARYFRQNGIPMVTTPIADGGPDATWAGAIEAPVVEAVVRVCTRLRIRRVALIPTAAVLGQAAPDGQFTWRDGEVALELHYQASALSSCRCMPAALTPAPHAADVTLDPPLDALGVDAVRYAGAYAAARAGATSPLALRPTRGADVDERSLLRNAVPMAACVASLLLALMAPSIAAARQQRIALDRLAAIGSNGAAAQRVEAALADSSRLLSELVGFQESAPATTLLLASLTRAIHPPAMLIGLRLDTGDGTLTALAPSASSLLTMLDDVADISGATISGSVTPESPAAPPLSVGMPGAPGPMAAGMGPAPARKLTRVTVRFHWSGERGTVLSSARSTR